MSHPTSSSEPKIRLDSNGVGVLGHKILRTLYLNNATSIANTVVEF